MDDLTYKINTEIYGNDISAMAFVVMVAVVGFLMYTFMRVQAVINKTKAY